MVQYYFATLDHIVSKFAVCNITFDELDSTRQVFQSAGRQIVRNSDGIATRDESSCQMRAYEAGAAGDQKNGQFSPSLGNASTAPVELPTLRTSRAAELLRRISAREARIGVIGQGYVGLPLGVEFGRAGFSVVGVDLDPRKCEAINRGASSIRDVPDDVVAELVAAGRLRAVTALADAGELDTVHICVPTPLLKTKDPDLSDVVAAAQAIARILRKGMLVVLESTTYPGTTEELVRGILEQTGLEAGVDFFLAYSPERVDPANRTWKTRNIPKVVGGLTSDCAELAATLYGTCVDRVVPVSSPRVAEMVKLLENSFRAVNIGFANELALIAERIGVDIWEVIEAAATKPFGFMPFFPGPGLGGHCIPVDPFFLSWKFREIGLEARFIDMAGEVNGAMPLHVVELIGEALNDHSKAVRGSAVLVIGVAYKPEVDDIRESPALDVIALLDRKGAKVSYHDPYVPRITVELATGPSVLESVPLQREQLAAADCVVVVTNHDSVDYAQLASVAPLVVDTRNAVPGRHRHVFRLGTPRPGA